MSKIVDFYFDFGSPAAYLAHTQIPKIAAETGAQIDFKPILLGGGFLFLIGWTWHDEGMSE